MKEQQGEEAYRRSDALFLIPPKRGIRLGHPSGWAVRDEM